MWSYRSPEPTAPSQEAADRWIRVADVALALLAVVFMAPLLLLLILTLLVVERGPIFFAHTRIGRHGAPFACFKFRTMVPDAEQRLAALLRADPAKRALWDRAQKLEDDPRVTPIGRLLRKSSLDELPQLFNVLRGDMSLVGPRPITPGEVARYGRRIDAYKSVRPGITGLWQVCGRSDVSYKRRVALDVTYVRRRSMRLYGKIVLGTVPAVLAGRGSC